ncbi:MAG: hypothetical protein WB783_06545 [Arenicellales bacterium]
MHGDVKKTTRRRVLTAIAVGGNAALAAKALPDKWMKPVVDSVLLPAHAQTSAVCTQIDESVSVFVFTSTNPNTIEFVVGGMNVDGSADVSQTGAFQFQGTMSSGGCSVEYVFNGTVVLGGDGSCSGTFTRTDTCAQKTCTGSGPFAFAVDQVENNIQTYIGDLKYDLCCTPTTSP